SDFTAIPLREMADEHVTYKQLITDAQGRYVTEAGPARQPAALPDPARRRPTRERNGRERTPVTPPAVAPSIAAAPPAARNEREPQPTSTPAQSAPASTAAAEPVAPLTAGMSGDGDAQALGRRRRRRGSRRRSERVGGVGEGMFSSEGGAEAESAFAESALPEVAFTESSLAEDAATQERFPEDPQADETAALDAEPTETVEVASDPNTTIAAASTEPAAPETRVAALAPVSGAPLRNRRRSARRPTSVIATADPGIPPSGAADEAVSAPPLASTTQTPDILWAADPAQANGTRATADADADARPGEPIAEESPAAPRPRSRRVSSARTRPRPAASR
ncbi:MAG: hypothetical protein M3069_02060, partial [Chloroflexota bacterium]|nr:hypothetical protein [Chloroflexota bacterium]